VVCDWTVKYLFGSSPIWTNRDVSYWNRCKYSSILESIMECVFHECKPFLVEYPRISTRLPRGQPPLVNENSRSVAHPLRDSPALWLLLHLIHQIHLLWRPLADTTPLQRCILSIFNPSDNSHLCLVHLHELVGHEIL
jgi:hypothetical protein